MTIIIGAIVSLLIFFFEQWWLAHHPIKPTAEAKQEFLRKLRSFRYFWMGPDRAAYGGILFDKFVANYEKNPPMATASALTADQAKQLAKTYASGLSL